MAEIGSVTIKVSPEFDTAEWETAAKKAALILRQPHRIVDLSDASITKLAAAIVEALKQS